MLERMHAVVQQDSGQLRVHLQTTLPLAEAAKAHQLLESGRTTGKIALTT